MDGALVQLSEREAFQAMSLFLDQFAERAGDDLLTLLGDVTLDEHGATFDPAAWDDWMACVDEVVESRLGEVMGQLDEREAFEAMSSFLDQFAERAGDDLLTLLSDIRLDEHGGTSDPAAWYDWATCVDKVVESRS